VPNTALIDAIKKAGGKAFEYRCYDLEPTNEPLNLDNADAILFTSANSYKMALLSPLDTYPLPMAIGDITADAMRAKGLEPKIIGDGTLEGTLKTLNTYLWNVK
jgi:uroporphyrinogen-III synthase